MSERRTAAVQQQIAAATDQLSERMGIEITGWDPGRMVATMPVAGNLQPYGLLHGGASCALAETLGSLAAIQNAPPGSIAMGIELNATHHRAVTSGTVTGTCAPLHTGRSIASYEIVITDEAGARVCTARLTCAIRPAR